MAEVPIERDSVPASSLVADASNEMIGEVSLSLFSIPRNQ
jgi:hypothetical protein